MFRHGSPHLGEIGSQKGTDKKHRSITYQQI
jgi:hypothetical protein